jgi:hypothetical protein
MQAELGIWKVHFSTKAIAKVTLASDLGNLAPASGLNGRE